MKRRAVLIAMMLAGSALAFGVQAEPREGRGRRREGRDEGGGRGHAHGRHGHRHDDGPRWGNREYRSWSTRRGRRDDDHDDRGRYYGYFDGRRDGRGRVHGDAYADLVYAGITAALARQYARDLGLGGFSSLPPGVRKKLARGRRLPPGLAKRMVPGHMARRLPRYPGHQWRISGTDLVLVSIASAVVADVLYDVFD